MRRWVIRLVGSLAFLMVAAYVAAAGYLFTFQRDYVFKPSGSLATPAESGLSGVATIALRAADGTDLTGWYAEPVPGLPTVLYFHGNAGSMSERSDRFRQIQDSGFGFLAVTYRGYPGSGGSPSEAALFSDALESFDWLRARTPDIVVYGESLGTGVATYVAAERQARALVLEAPYTAAVDIAAETYPWLPASLLMRDPFLSREHIRRVDEPVLIVHGTADKVIPVDNGRRLFEAAGEPKQLAIIAGAGHGDLWDHGLWRTVLDFLRTVGVAAQPAAAVRRMPSFAG